MSKKNITVDTLDNNITEQFAWRRKELHLLLKKIPETTNEFQKLYLRAGITLLYAHWEGFIKEATSSYLQHISMQRLNHSELKSQFVALCLKNKIKELDINKLKTQARTVDFLIHELHNRAYVPYKTIINTRANLKFNILEEIFYIIGLEIEEYKLKKETIDELVELRNNIAHGKNSPIIYKTYLEYHNEIINLMEKIKDEIVTAAFKKSYRRK